MKEYEQTCRGCKELFVSPVHTRKYCDACTAKREKKQLERGVRKVRECKECLRPFKPYHHAVKYCNDCRVRQKRTPKNVEADSLAEYAFAVTDGGRDIVDLLVRVMKDKLYTNYKGGRGKQRKKIKVSADQMLKAGKELKEIVWGRAPLASDRPVQTEKFQPTFIKVEDNIEGIGVFQSNKESDKDGKE